MMIDRMYLIYGTGCSSKAYRVLVKLYAMIKAVILMRRKEYRKI
jgi:predicted peroxiredoxin